MKKKRSEQQRQKQKTLNNGERSEKIPFKFNIIYFSQKL